jgi:hypothetical protein
MDIGLIVFLFENSFYFSIFICIDRLFVDYSCIVVPDSFVYFNKQAMDLLLYQY